MNEPLILMCVLLVGMLLGAVFFGGLWWTVDKAASSKQPAVLFLFSLLIRLSIVLVGFYFMGRGHWERFLICLLGFIMARFIVIRLTRNIKEQHILKTKEGHYAP